MMIHEGLSTLAGGVRDVRLWSTVAAAAAAAAVSFTTNQTRVVVWRK
jgi:hypothetical protein